MIGQFDLASRILQKLEKQYMGPKMVETINIDHTIPRHKHTDQNRLFWLSNSITKAQD
jgi:hypothetical protein